MAGITVSEVISDFFTYAPKLAAFEAGSPVTLPIAAASYTLDIPNVGDIMVSESGTSVVIQKVAAPAAAPVA